MGGDALAVRVCEELCATQGHRVALIWMQDHDLSAKLERLGCDYFSYDPNDYDALRIACVGEAASIMTLADDDRLNLQVALKARDINPSIRLVLRQFNRTLGAKLEQNLPNCSVISPASHSAATFAATALDPACFYALQFPDRGGVHAGFTQRRAGQLGVAGMSVRDAQQKLRARIVARNGSPDVSADDAFEEADTLVVFALVEHLEATSGTRQYVRVERRKRPLTRMRVAFVKRMQRLQNLDPIVLRVAAVTLTIFMIATAYFTIALQRDPFTAAYFVITTATTTGYGDITPVGHGWPTMLFAMIVMVTGVAASGIFIAFVTSALTRAQFIAMQGLRQIRTRGHVLICGSGNVGTRVIDTLGALGERVVVIDRSPDPALVEWSRTRRIELLTGDATDDRALDLCNIANARAVVALTDSDTANLEVALGARARNPLIPVVMRVQDDVFAGSIARQFEAIRTYSTTALAAPAFAMLSRFPGTRGRIAFGDDTYNVGERQQGEIPQPPPADHCIPLGVWRGGAFCHIDAFDEMEPYDRLLFIVPLSQFKTPHGAPHESSGEPVGI